MFETTVHTVKSTLARPGPCGVAVVFGLGSRCSGPPSPSVPWS